MAKKYKADRRRYVSVVKDTDFIDDTVTYHKKYFSNYKGAEADSFKRSRNYKEMVGRGSFVENYVYDNYSAFKKYKIKRKK